MSIMFDKVVCAALVWTSVMDSTVGSVLYYMVYLYF